MLCIVGNKVFEILFSKFSEFSAFEFTFFNKKVFLYEVYKNNNAAVFHVEQFQGSDWEKEFFEIFELKDFQVLGNSEDSLKKVLDGFTNDFRTKEGGYHKVIEGLKSEILNFLN